LRQKFWKLMLTYQRSEIQLDLHQQLILIQELLF